MIFLRCRCGFRKSWSSGIFPKPCEGCARCGTRISDRPEGNTPIELHDFEDYWDIDRSTGARIRMRRCRQCNKTVERRAVPR